MSEKEFWAGVKFAIEVLQDDDNDHSDAIAVLEAELPGAQQITIEHSSDA